MNLVKKIAQFFRDLFSKKPDDLTETKDISNSVESETAKGSNYKSLVIKVSSTVYKYLKKFVIFIFGLIHTMMLPMINIAKKHPIAFCAAIILHSILLYGLINSNIDRWGVAQKKPSTSETAPAKAIMVDIGIREAERERLVEL